MKPPCLGRLPYLISCRIYFIPCSDACEETGKINVVVPYTIKCEALERAEIAGRDMCCCDRTLVLIQPCWVHTVICVHSSRTWREQIDNRELRGLTFYKHLHRGVKCHIGVAFCLKSEQLFLVL